MPLYGIPKSGTVTRPVTKLGYFNAFESLEFLLVSEDVVDTLGQFSRSQLFICAGCRRAALCNDSTGDGFVRTLGHMFCKLFYLRVEHHCFDGYFDESVLEILVAVFRTRAMTVLTTGVFSTWDKTAV